MTLYSDNVIVWNTLSDADLDAHINYVVGKIEGVSWTQDVLRREMASLLAIRDGLIVEQARRTADRRRQEERHGRDDRTDSR